MDAAEIRRPCCRALLSDDTLRWWVRVLPDDALRWWPPDVPRSGLGLEGKNTRESFGGVRLSTVRRVDRVDFGGRRVLFVPGLLVMRPVLSLDPWLSLLPTEIRRPRPLLFAFFRMARVLPDACFTPGDASDLLDPAAVAMEADDAAGEAAAAAIRRAFVSASISSRTTACMSAGSSDKAPANSTSGDTSWYLCQERRVVTNTSCPSIFAMPRTAEKANRARGR